MDPRTFERQVADAYRQLGADVQHDAILAGSQIDVLISEATPSGSRVKRAVECKAYSGAVGVPVVRSFASLIDLLRSRALVDGGVLVSLNGFTARARQAAAELNLEVLEYLDLETRVGTARSSSDPRPAGAEVEISDAPRPSETKRVFVVMPFAPELDDLYMLGIRETCEQLGFVVERADEVEHNVAIMEVILDRIRTADVVVGEMSHSNPNVYYEVGYAHALDRPVILCSRTGNPIPFDLAAINHILYSSIVDFRDKFRRRLTAVLEG